MLKAFKTGGPLLTKWNYTTDTGIVHEMPFDEYLALDRVSNSTLGKVHNSPLGFKWSLDHDDNDDTTSIRKGHLSHALVLDPETVTRDYVIMPPFKLTTKQGRLDRDKFVKDNEKKLIITEKEWHESILISHAVLGNEKVQSLMQDGFPEVTLLWQDEETELFGKSRLDWLTGASHQGIGLDLKTINDVSEIQIQRHCVKFGYHRQAALYMWAANLLNIPLRAFLFIFVQNSPPYDVALLQLPAIAIHQGFQEIRKALNTYAECNKTGIWPGYSDQITTLEWPRWATK